MRTHNSPGIPALQNHLFEVLEGLKNLSDPEASENEKVTIEQAKAIVEVSDTIIDTYKLELDAVKFIDKAENFKFYGKAAAEMGLIEESLTQ